jgi:hypothetical protein
VPHWVLRGAIVEAALSQPRHRRTNDRYFFGGMNLRSRRINLRNKRREQQAIYDATKQVPFRGDADLDMRSFASATA